MIKKITLLLVAAFALVVTTQESCKKSEDCDKKSCLKGRLEVAGICLNYTIKVLEGNIDPALVESVWTDSNTGKSYTNVFGLKSICTFPKEIKEGEEFYFEINNTEVQDCFVCKAFYPTPSKKLSIKVLKTGCTETKNSR